LLILQLICIFTGFERFTKFVINSFPLKQQFKKLIKKLYSGHVSHKSCKTQYNFELHFACRQVSIKNPLQYEVFTVAVSDKPPSVMVTVKLNSSDVLVHNFTLLVFNNTELILQNSTQTERLEAQIPRGVFIFVVQKSNIKPEPHTFEITQQTTNITIVVSKY